MQGDFTRLTFDPSKNYSRVLMQQGRVQLDADWNEAADIQLYLLRTLARDLIGPHGGPGGPAELGFEIKEARDSNNNPVPRDFKIGAGRYYVDGILCESRRLGDQERRFTEQPSFLAADFGDLSGNRVRAGLVYLDVWERHITALEDEDETKIGIHEPALRELDTTTRAQVVWQVRFLELTGAALRADFKMDYPAFLAFLANNSRVGLGGGRLRARANPSADADTLCTTAPEARYRGAENQLYRVEVHKGGAAWNGVRNAQGQPAGNIAGAATFKWSRENGAVIFPIATVAGQTVTLKGLGQDERLGLHDGGWVEVVDDLYILRNRAEPLLEIEAVNAEDLTVQLQNGVANDVGGIAANHPLLRRWDSVGALPIQVSTNPNEGWLPLEDGVEIKFEAAANEIFRSGDYWLIPARVATGDVDWPGTRANPLPQPPHGIEHHYAPLAIISLNANGEVVFSGGANRDLRRRWTAQAA